MTDHRFWIRLAATVAVAAEIVTSGEKILSFDAGRIVRWLVDQMVARISVPTPDWAYEALGQFINSNQSNQIVVDGPFLPGQTATTVWVKPVRELHIRREKSGGKVYIDKQALRAWCVKRGINMRELMQELLNAGVCINQSKNITLGAGTDYSSTQVQCVQIDGTHPKVSGLFRGESANVLPFRRDEPNSDEDLELDMPY